MDLSESSFNQLVDILYQTLEDNTVWKKFFDEVAQAIDVNIVHMLGVDKKHTALSYSDGANMPAHGELTYIQNYHSIDPRVPIVFGTETMKWVHCHQHLDEVFVANNPFYQEFLIPYGLRYMSACKVVDDDNAIIIFSTLRKPEQGPLPDEALSFLDGLMPHLARVCRLTVKNYVYSTQALVGHALINKLRQAVVLATTTGDVVHINEAASTLLRQSSGVYISNNKLQFPFPYDQEFYQVCHRLEQENFRPPLSAGSKGTEFTTLKVRYTKADGQTDSIYAFITMLIPEQMMGTFGLRPLIMVFFYHPEADTTIDPSLLTAAFGLSPAECRIAIYLAEGCSLKEIARKLDVQFDTIRKQLQSIYHKTSTNRQPELIRLLLNLPSNAFGSLRKD
ncbi:helix-turn-helix transcriptional regulator [Methylovorus mays]|uniref:helix-turn-helix transcriptional regulator n=1 Tax=Methylovorus mays TaxID=184077 RepID=UPI001E56782A|nr:helix-turn-helix transcriptional regulator [Methylovorus mays]MCB5206493.1 helix-turn-helix transcriptional regulator [Methylovorus mays]